MTKIQKSAEIVTTLLVQDIGRLIEDARGQVARAANAALTALYWQIGTRIRQDVLEERRADYGNEIVATLGRQLSERFGRGFGEKNLRRMVQFAEVFPHPEIVATLQRQLSWSHFKLLIPMKEQLKRDFYTEMCRLEGWSTRVLQNKIDGMLYERTALSKKPDKLIRQELDCLRENDKLTPEFVFQDPYLLDFLGLKDTYSEKDLESALLHEIERFLLELGAGFAFIERQKRIVLDGDDYYIDLLFFHRRLRRLIVIDLLCFVKHNNSSVASRVMCRPGINGRGWHRRRTFSEDIDHINGFYSDRRKAIKPRSSRHGRHASVPLTSHAASASAFISRLTSA